MIGLTRGSRGGCKLMLLRTYSAGGLTGSTEEKLRYLITICSHVNAWRGGAD